MTTNVGGTPSLNVLSFIFMAIGGCIILCGTYATAEEYLKALTYHFNFRDIISEVMGRGR